MRRRLLRLVPADRRLLLPRSPGSEWRADRDRQLAWTLAFSAGYLNAGGFLALGFYTSHVTGTISRIADSAVTGDLAFVAAGAGIVMAFFSGAFTTGWLVSFGRRRRFKSYFAFSLFIETLLLLVFSLLGSPLDTGVQHFTSAAAFLLSFVMGMHNAVITKISSAAVRTTHMTGMVTDLGIEFSRLLYFNRKPSRRVARVVANRAKLKLHGLILASFFGGGLMGAWAFKQLGYRAVLPVALALLLLCLRPLKADLSSRLRLRARFSR